MLVSFWSYNVRETCIKAQNPTSNVQNRKSKSHVSAEIVRMFTSEVSYNDFSCCWSICLVLLAQFGATCITYDGGERGLAAPEDLLLRHNHLVLHVPETACAHVDREIIGGG